MITKNYIHQVIKCIKKDKTTNMNEQENEENCIEVTDFVAIFFYNMYDVPLYML